MSLIASNLWLRRAARTVRLTADLQRPCCRARTWPLSPNPHIRLLSVQDPFMKQGLLCSEDSKMPQTKSCATDNGLHFDSQIRFSHMI